MSRDPLRVRRFPADQAALRAAGPALYSWKRQVARRTASARRRAGFWRKRLPIYGRSLGDSAFTATDRRPVRHRRPSSGSSPVPPPVVLALPKPPDACRLSAPPRRARRHRSWRDLPSPSCLLAALAGLRHAAATLHIVSIDSSARSPRSRRDRATTPLARQLDASPRRGSRSPPERVYLSSTTNDSLYTLDLSRPPLRSWVPTATCGRLHGWSTSPHETLYGASSHNVGCSVITSPGPRRSSAPWAHVGHDLGWNPLLACVRDHSATDSLYTMDLATGAATLVGPLGGPTNRRPRLPPLTGTCSSSSNSTTPSTAEHGDGCRHADRLDCFLQPLGLRTSTARCPRAPGFAIE